MRKRVLKPDPSGKSDLHGDWLPLDQIATVEVTSEDASHPVENALLTGTESGWRASQTGDQTIRLIFDAPQRIRRIYVEFVEREMERNQEFVLRWSDGKTQHEIVRQQWNFSPGGSAQQAEDYTVDLQQVTQLELVISPDRGRGQAVATLEKLRLA